MNQNFKTIIWQEALDLFLKYGYKGVSVKTIADTVGISDTLLYQYYKKKQDIFYMILEEVLKKIGEEKQTFLCFLDSSYQATDDPFYLGLLHRIYDHLFSFYLNDTVVSKFRKVLMMEENYNFKIFTIFRKVFIDNMLEFEAFLFKELIQKGFLPTLNPYAMALHFYSSTFLLVREYDLEQISYEKIQKQIPQLVFSLVNYYMR